MSSVEVSLDVDRALDSAVADVGEALQLRRRAVADTHLRRGLKQRALDGADPEAMDAASCARMATALFILGRDADTGRFASRSEDVGSRPSPPTRGYRGALRLRREVSPSSRGSSADARQPGLLLHG